MLQVNVSFGYLMCVYRSNNPTIVFIGNRLKAVLQTAYISAFTTVQNTNKKSTISKRSELLKSTAN